LITEFLAVAESSGSAGSGASAAKADGDAEVEAAAEGAADEDGAAAASDAYIVYMIKSSVGQNMCTHPPMGDPACDTEMPDGSLRARTEEWVAVPPLRPAHAVASASTADQSS
jgi:hypothetical protein